MSQVNTQQMGRMVAAGNKGDLGQAVDILARLGALHIIDYDGSEDDQIQMATALSLSVSSQDIRDTDLALITIPLSLTL